MSTKVETLENSMVKVTIEVPAETFDAAINKVYMKTRGQIQIPGFRKGKAPRKLIEKTYGAGVFFEDAANECIPEAYEAAVEAEGLEVVSRPEIDVEQIEAGKPFIFTAEVAVKPEITLGEYKGLEVEKEEVEVTEEEITAELTLVQDKNSRKVEVTDRAVQNDDEVNLNFDGSVDGVPFDGGKAEGHELVIGSGQFIPGFEEQMIGMEIDEEKDIHVTFPEEYHAEELAGKEAVFAVKVNGIKVKELPALDDELAQDVSEFDTLDEYKASIKEDLQKKKEEQAVAARRDAILDKAIENATAKLPDPMVELEAENMVNDMANRLQYQGLSLDQYMQFTGQNMASMKESMKVEAEKAIMMRLVLEGVSIAESIDATDEEVDDEIKRMAEMYGVELEKIQETIHEEERESIKQDLLNKKALDFIVENAKA